MNPGRRQNRVTPFGEIVSVPERGTLMGNRGVLHNRDGQIRRDWRLKRWILCLLEFKGRHRSIMTPDRYTELFFLDEATGLAAGHRPCAECQRTRFNEYRAAWVTGIFSGGPTKQPTADEIDDCLHRDRLDAIRSKRTYKAYLDDLPDGVFITMEGRQAQALLVQGDSLLVWSAGGYRERIRRAAPSPVAVLTPLSSVAAIRAGFAAQVHSSAGALQCVTLSNVPNRRASRE
jgi:hypothetical protein